MSAESSSPRSDGDSARDNEYRLFEVRQVASEDGSVETRKERNDRLAQPYCPAPFLGPGLLVVVERPIDR
jgi:hypothetical protein